MREQASDLKNPNFEPSVQTSRKVAITAVAAILLITVACICSYTLVTVSFLLNPPW